MSDGKLTTNGDVTLIGAGADVPYDDKTNTIDMNNGGSWIHNTGAVTADKGAVIQIARGSETTFNKGTTLSLNDGSFVELLQSDMNLNGTTVKLTKDASFKLWGKDDEQSPEKGSIVTLDNNSTMTTDETSSLTVAEGSILRLDNSSTLETKGTVTLEGPEVAADDKNAIDLNNGSTWTHTGAKVTADKGAIIEAALGSKVEFTKADLSLNNGSYVELLKSDMTVNGGSVSLTNGASMQLWGKENEEDSSIKGSTVTVSNAKLDVADTSYITVQEDSTLKLDNSELNLNKSSLTVQDDGYVEAANNSTINVTNGSTIHLATGTKDTDLELAGSTMNVTDSTITLENNTFLDIDDAYDNSGKQGSLVLNDKAVLTLKDSAEVGLDNGTMTVGKGAKLDVSSSANAHPVTVGDITHVAPIRAVNGSTVIFADGSSTYTTANDKNEIQTVAAVDKDSHVIVNKNAGLYVNNAKVDNTTKYTYDKVIANITPTGHENDSDKVDSYSKWDGRIFGKNQLQELNTTTGLYENKSINEVYTGVSAANAMQAAYLSADGPAYDFIDAVQTTFRTGDTAADNANITYALNSSAGLTGLAGVGYGLASFSDTLSRSVNTHDAADGNVWASYIHDKRTVDGLKVGNLDADYDLTYNGAVIGVDFGNSDTTRYGLALAYADGDVSTNGGLVSTQNDADYYGGSLYGVWNGAKGLTYKAELGYTKSSNDLTQYNTGTKITASTDADAVYAGVRAEKAIESASGTWTPYAGLRYTRLAVDDYTDSLGFAHNSDNAGIWNLPVGVAYSHESKSSSGWTYTPSVELGYQFAFGNKTMDETVSFGAGSDLFGVDIAENSFLGRLSFTAANDDLAFGVHYGYQKGSNTDSKAWGVSASLKF